MPRSPIVWSLIIVALAIGVGAAASKGDPLVVALFILWWGILGVAGWTGNYEELREDSVYVSHAAGLHAPSVMGIGIPYDSILSVTTRRSKDAILHCLDKGKPVDHKIMLASDERDEFVAELVRRIEATCGRTVEVRAE